MTQSTSSAPTILDLLANLAKYDPTLYPLARFVSANSKDQFESNGAEWVRDGGSGAGGVFIFTPSASPQSGNVYGDWSELIAALAVLPVGSLPVVRFTASFSVPALGMPALGWDLAGGVLQSYSRQSGLVVVTIPDGVSITNCGGVGYGLEVDIAPTVALSPEGTFRFPASQIGGAMIFVVQDGAGIVQAGTGPMIVSPGALLLQTTMVLALFASQQGATPPLVGPLLKLNADDGAVAATFNCGPAGGMQDGWLVGGGPGSTLFDVRGIDSTFPLIPGFTGGGGTVVITATNAANLQYKATPAQWAPAAPTNAEAAINRLAVAVAGLLGGPIP